MRANCLLLCVALQIHCIGAESVRKYVAETFDHHVVRAIFDMTGTLPPHWAGRTLIGVQDNHSNGPLIYLIDKEGYRDQFSFAIRDAGIIYVHGLAVSSDRTVAIAGGAVSGDSRAGSFVALVSPDRKSQTVVRTWPYVPWEAVFVPDGSLWTVGYTFHDTEDRIVKPNIMAHFDRTGKLLASFPVSTKPRFGAERPAALQHSFLRTSLDRMAWFTNGLEYIEFSFDGSEIGRYDGPQVRDLALAARWASFGLSDANEVFFSTILNDKRETWQLDRGKREWVPIQFEDSSLPAWSHLLGCDGETLVVTGKPHEIRRYKTADRPNIQ